MYAVMNNIPYCIPTVLTWQHDKFLAFSFLKVVFDLEYPFDLRKRPLCLIIDLLKSESLSSKATLSLNYHWLIKLLIAHAKKNLTQLAILHLIHEYEL